MPFIQKCLYPEWINSSLGKKGHVIILFTMDYPPCKKQGWTGQTKIHRQTDTSPLALSATIPLATSLTQTTN